MERQALGQISLQQSIAVLTSLATESGDVTTFLDYYKTFSPNGKLQNQLNAKRALGLFLDHLGTDAKLPLDQITKKHVETFCSSQLERMGAGTVRSYKTHIATFFNTALQDGLVNRNPGRRQRL